ncbi:MAG: hypothetical protein J7M40_08875 [Planctomycetes bacterium]|nr:hypothetical protein [Planctomycetota bacterium]
MKMKSQVSLLFLVAAIYDGILGGAFLIAPQALFKWLNVTEPNHYGYVHFPAALLIVFAVMFLSIALKPISNRRLIPYGIGLKLSYCGVVFWHWFGGGIPNIWKPFALCDVAFMVLFFLAHVYLAGAEHQSISESAASS